MVGAGRWCALAAGLAAALVLAGCTETVSGSAVSERGASGSARPKPQSSSTSAKPQEASAAELLGELTTIDPCSLTDPNGFAEFGTAEPAPPDSLDECLLKIKTSVPEPIDLYVGSLDRTESYPDLEGKSSTVVSGGLKLVDYETGSNTYCAQLLVFADGITLSVNGSAYTTEEPKLCRIVRTAVDGVLKVLRDDDVKHRSFASNSLGKVDPCGVAPASAVAAVPGLGSVKPKSFPARHACSWTSSDNTVRVRVMFAVGSPPKPVGEGATESQIAGRASVLSPTPRAGSFAFCGAHTGHIPFTAEGQSAMVEIATVFVRMREGQVGPACEAATALANAVWPKLPKP